MNVRYRIVIISAVVAGASLFAAAAPKAAGKAKTAPVPEAVMKEAKEIFAQRCATCHGAAGVGDGPAAAALNPKPRNFQDAAWQKSVTDAQIEKVIVEGGPAVGKSPLMPPNPDLANKPVIAGLRQYIRSLAKK